jgi:hypothetical protein
MVEKKNVPNPVKEKEQVDFRKYLNAYVYETVLPGTRQKVKFKPFTTGQIKSLLTIEDVNPMSVEDGLDKMISECLVGNEIDIYDLYAQDRFFLLMEIRKKSKGSTYKFQWICPKCNSQSLQTVSLDNLKINQPKKLSDTLKLSSDISVVLQNITRRAQKNAMIMAQESIDRGERASVINTNLNVYALSLKSIITPEGEIDNLTIDDAMDFIYNCPSLFTDRIKEWFDENDFGVELKITAVCPHCQNKEEAEVPLDNFFF